MFLGCGGVAGPARAQQRACGGSDVSALASDDPEARAATRRFCRGLQELGWAVGRNVGIDYRWARAMPTAFVETQRSWWRSRPTSCWLRRQRLWPLQQATRTVPIVFAGVIDPVGAGFVASLRGRAATPLASICSSTADRPSGWSCSSEIAPGRREWQSFAIPPRRHRPIR